MVDNDGGGIFSFLPQASAVADGALRAALGHPHGADLAAIAAAYGVPVTTVGRAAEVWRRRSARRCRPAGVRMVLARTDRAANVAVHDELNAAVAAAVAGL